MYPDLWRFNFWGLLSEPFVFHSYGLMLAIGFLVALQLSARQAAAEGEDPEKMLDLGFYLLVSGLVGGRLVYILTNLQDFTSNAWLALQFWRGGLVWYGGFIGAVVFMIWYTRTRKMPFFQYVDFVIPNMALGHGIGRFGCLLSGCCHGRPSGNHMGIVFPDGSPAYFEHLEHHLIQVGQHALPVYPTQLWEAGFEFVLFAWLVWMRPRKRFHGQLFLLWMSVYPLGRAVIEHFRGDSIRGIYILSTSQYISIFVTICAMALAFRKSSQFATP